jgi:hypothetical protein
VSETRRDRYDERRVGFGGNKEGFDFGVLKAGSNPSLGRLELLTTVLASRERFHDRRNTMKTVAYHGPGDIRLDNIPEPTIQDSGDAIVALT